MPDGTTTLGQEGRSEQADPAPTGRVKLPAERRPVVVGVDHSSGSIAAVRWAAAEARSRGVGLRVVHSWAWQMLDPWTHTVDRGVIADLKLASRALVEKSAALAGADDGLTVDADSLEGYPPDVLAELGEDAALLVVGSHHLTAFGRALMGSVSSALVARASCPVVVLAAPRGLAGENPSIVVGVTGTDHDKRVLEFAFGYASRRRHPLRALFFWHPPFGDSIAAPPQRAQAWLSESLAGWREQFPDVEVHSAVVRDHPVAGLVTAAASQDLLVVGRHARRLRLGTLLGSVSLGVLHHATCPVAVIPPASTDAD